MPGASACGSLQASRNPLGVVRVTVRYVKLGLSEQELREGLEEELTGAMRAEGGVPTLHAIAHAVARVIEVDHLRIAEQLEAAGVRLEGTTRSS